MSIHCTEEVPIICFEVIFVINSSGLGKSKPMNITWVDGSSKLPRISQDFKN